MWLYLLTHANCLLQGRNFSHLKCIKPVIYCIELSCELGVMSINFCVESIHLFIESIYLICECLLHFSYILFQFPLHHMHVFDDGMQGDAGRFLLGHI